ncbi:LytR/AlgR family response regulator transcription factor [Faecalibaculum rodentium]|uniref:LytR/AlgR family response regulator transcription factor n=1 Tax=Faecalibaculum rodentium TaxID=1702221 RepID=UPI0023F1AD7C|nr:LytTR family DNA-binding domain-containing protein [Faecalibaculum rodentium]
MEEKRKTELILCEDDDLQRQNLARTISAMAPDLTVTELRDAAGLQRFLQKPLYEPGHRIYLMDIVLGNGENGIDLARFIHRIDPNAPIIFMSAYLEKSCEVYEVEHCYFIYKPQKEQRLKAALAKAMKQLEEQPQPLVIHDGTAVYRIDPSAILCMERVRRCTYITCRNRILKAREDLEELLKHLPDTFVQCHRSYVVNFAMTSAFYGTEFEMANGLHIPVSRARQQEIRQAYSGFLLKEEALC